jgi:o-succinylbenzoate---CoA ligase
VRLPPGPAFVDALDRAWVDGDAVAPLDPHAPADATRRLLDALRPAVLRDADGEQPLAGAVAVADRTALVVATSGYAKAAVLGHDALAAATRASVARLGGRAGDRWLCCLPTHHVAGIAVLLRARALGGEAIVHARFDPEAVAAEDTVTHVSLVPTMLTRLLDARVDVARYATILLGGAAAPQGLLERARAAGARVVTTYGMTETCGGCVYDGRPLDGFEVRVGDGGRIRIRGPIARGYRLRDDLTGAAFVDGWFVTSDLGRWEGGRLVVTGRADDVIVTGGENVDATSIARALVDHPAVADAAVVGFADPAWGQAVVAFCVPDGADVPSDDALRAHVRGRLGRAAAPKQVRWVRAIPRGALGKVRRDLLMRDDGGDDYRSDDG